MDPTFILVISIFLVVGIFAFIRLRKHVALLKSGDRVVAKIVSLEKKIRHTNNDNNTRDDYTYIINIVYSHNNQGYADSVRLSESSMRTYMPHLFNVEGLRVGGGSIVINNEEFPIIVDKQNSTKITTNYDQLLAKAHPEHYDANYDKWKTQSTPNNESPGTEPTQGNDANENPYA